MLKGNSSSLETKLSHNRKLANFGKRFIDLRGRVLLHSGRWSYRSKICPSMEDFVTQRTSTKCGPKMPLIGGLFVTKRTFYQMWSEMCPSLEDFVTQWTLTKCGPKCAPLWRTLSWYGLYSVMVQYMPQLKKKWQSCSRGRHKPMVSGVNNINRSNEDQKPPDSVHVIEPKMIKNDAYCTNHAMKDKWHASQATIDPQWCSIVYPWIGNGFIAFTWTIWRFVHAYAGLLVNGLMITEFACREA